jgi:integrase/recombinase XerD
MNASKDEPFITGFLDALWLEEGLSENTRKAYASDIEHFGRWMDQWEGRSLLEITAGDIEAYLAKRFHEKVSSRSVARLLSSLRKFYRYHLREGRIDLDPTLRIDPPRMGRPLPKTLTEWDVERLLAAPDAEDSLGCRDRAMLEVLYATGLRVSELVSVRFAQVNTNQGVIRILGKGNRERLIPLGDESVRWLA